MNRDLLPFAGFPKYTLDTWGRPHGKGGQGQRRGPLTAIRLWKLRKGQKPRFIYGYRLYSGGERVFKSALVCAMARSKAELAALSPKKAQYLARIQHPVGAPADSDGREAEAMQVIRDNPALPLRKVVEILKAMGIKRGKDWVGHKRFKLSDHYHATLADGQGFADVVKPSVVTAIRTDSMI